ncbi:hydrolase [Streptacidiphilus sp. ASG 303]|uniref:alpha/beta hydrolase family protein n=1 Tax=Streptacidiphilus sp. ASG 303 TaxID=2896847 RepID=UPI001E44F203|nr:alpha/beta family hydrolase [Streptacidiphilus sp. ASG 303]MCD0482852.1 hydrolase [Streptacidiphilus sp. ASG 303]
MERRTVATPAGDARVSLARAEGRPRALLALGHGAGGGVEARDLQAVAAALPPLGVTVALVEQPWRVAGRRVAPAPAALDTGWLPVAEALAADADGVPLLVGGRSAGARVACRTALRSGAAGVVALAFPLHPPGRPERSRAGELTGAGVPVLVVQGLRDPFGRPGEFPAPPPGGALVAVPGADHGFAVPRRGAPTQEEALAAVAGAVADWVLRLAG